MLNSVQQFITPNQQSYYVGQAVSHQLAQALDTNGDGNLEQTELRVNDYFKNRMDTNGDQAITVVEFADSLNANQVSFGNPSEQMARAVAGALIQNQVYAGAFGEMGATLDRDQNGLISRQELTRALRNREVTLSGQYLVNGPSTSPVQPPTVQPPIDWRPDETQEAKEYINTIKAMTKNRKPNGNYDHDSGLYTHQQADQLINNYLQNQVMSSQYIRPAEKIQLIEEQLMGRKSNGNYDYDSGSLSHSQAREMINQVMSQTQHPQHMEHYQAQEHLNMIESLTKSRKSNGNYDHYSGIYTHSQADEMIRSFLNDHVLNSSYMSPSDKIQLIEAQIMDRKSNGNYDYDSGSLSHSQAREMIHQVMSQTQHPQHMEHYQAQEHLNMIESLTKSRKSNGNYDHYSGIYTHSQADEMIRGFLNDHVLNSSYMSPSDKIQLIEAQIMGRKSNGNYDYDSGSLSHSQAREMINQVMNQSLVEVNH